MKRTRLYLLIIVLSILYVYMLNVDAIPSHIVLFQNENCEIAHFIRNQH